MRGGSFITADDTEAGDPGSPAWDDVMKRLERAEKNLPGPGWDTSAATGARLVDMKAKEVEQVAHLAEQKLLALEAEDGEKLKAIEEQLTELRKKLQAAAPQPVHPTQFTTEDAEMSRAARDALMAELADLRERLNRARAVHDADAAEEEGQQARTVLLEAQAAAAAAPPS